MKKNILIIGAGGVAHVAAHKCAQHNDILGHICIASRTISKCHKIIESVHRKDHLKDKSKKLYARQIDALDTKQVIEVIRDTCSEIVLNLGSAFLNMSVLDACIETGTTYLDTAIYEDPEKVCEEPPWYENYEWKKRDLCKEKGISSILGIGFDPGLVNAYCAYAQKHLFDEIKKIDIMDVNVGSHGKYFATNFDPEINLREFVKVWSWVGGEWKEFPVHTVKRSYNFPEVGMQTVYLNGHDELHSLSSNFNVENIRFWMGFSDHYINVFTVLKNIGLTSHLPVVLEDGKEVVPLKLLKALLPDPMSLAPKYTGKTCIGNLIQGTYENQNREVFIYNICDHQGCYEEVESQAISYTAGVPAVAAAILVAKGVWDPKTMVNVEELDPDPLIEFLDGIGFKTEIREHDHEAFTNSYNF